jgi:branched-chain amino acid transport system ATP-binding protein
MRSAPIPRCASGTSVSENLLEVTDLVAGYGQAIVLKGVSLTVGEHEVVGVLGPNGAGKTTLLKTIFGAIKPRAGSIRVAGVELRPDPAFVIRAGLAIVPEGRRVFATMTVHENLLVGSYARRRGTELDADVKRLLELFPILERRRRQLAGNLSGGEQQMLAIARAMVSKPRLLLMDEPSLGLAPIMVKQVGTYIEEIRQSFGTSVLLVEQNAALAATVSSRIYVMNVGEVVASGSSDQFRDEESVVRAYWGGGEP